ncbi:MAG: hypothetical protein FWH27_10425 [Planctomycetaceae bacterium]|nr:hypothetical protein [Planctomycetaceae bacterium]
MLDESEFVEHVIRKVVLADDESFSPDALTCAKRVVEKTDNAGKQSSGKVKRFFKGLWERIKIPATWFEPVSEFLCENYRKFSNAKSGRRTELVDAQDEANIRKTEAEAKLLEIQALEKQVGILDKVVDLRKKDAEARNLEADAVAKELDLENRKQQLEQRGIVISTRLIEGLPHLAAVKPDLTTEE